MFYSWYWRLSRGVPVCLSAAAAVVAWQVCHAAHYLVFAVHFSESDMSSAPQPIINPEVKFKQVFCKDFF